MVRVENRSARFDRLGRPSLVPENSSFFRAITGPRWNAAAITKPARLIPADKSSETSSRFFPIPRIRIPLEIIIFTSQPMLNFPSLYFISVYYRAYISTRFGQQRAALTFVIEISKAKSTLFHSIYCFE